VRVVASSKLNTVHSHISKALENCNISDEEYKLVFSDEVEKYRAMKEEIRRKQGPSSLIDQGTKRIDPTGAHRLSNNWQLQNLLLS